MITFEVSTSHRMAVTGGLGCCLAVSRALVICGGQTQLQSGPAELVTSQRVRRVLQCHIRKEATRRFGAKPDLRATICLEMIHGPVPLEMGPQGTSVSSWNERESLSDEGHVRSQRTGMAGKDQSQPTP
ncbi:hypothetical protein N657DRAFT_57396 [Parathielavia appendiculata]|uniref:Uncharacterized protein n=1 Tax=Parathielavia appendiculata TaxID=2587402 RepID=A0AAN6UAR0_9PEZI|nr:hypothetical protein N657DRAFT_57396 [Parathielavia appendiculata]